jgi:hypothetical protein
MELRSQDDPRVQFYKIVGAGSSLNFGLSDAQKRKLGFYFVTAGGAFLLVIGFAVSYMMKRSRSRRRDGYVAAPTGGFHQPANIIINNPPPQQVVYQQPQYQQPQYQQQRYQTPQPQYQQANQYQAPQQPQYNTNSMPTARAYQQGQQGQNPQFMAPTVPAYNQNMQNLPQAKAYKQ